MLFKNVANQKIHVYAYDSTTGAAKTGDAANITAYVSLDGTANAIDDTNPAEVDATNMPGVYCFDLAQAETNCNAFALYAKSSTSNIRIEPIIGFTTGAETLNVNASHLGGTAQTGRDIGASVLLSSGTGAGQLDFTSGVVKSNLVQILASTLSGTAAQIAAAFVKLFDVATPSLTAASKDQTGDAYAQIGTAGAALTAIPWNASWDAEVQSECTDALNAYDPPTKAEVDTACGAVTLKNGAHGGAAATVTLKSVVVDNSEGDAVNFKSTAANKMALKLEGAGTGNSHALYLNSNNGSAIAGASGSHGVSITSSAGHGMVIAGATGDIVADITGDLSGAVGSVTTAVDINSNADITAILQDTGTTLDGKINTLDTVVDLIEDIVRNKMEVVEATGAATLYADDSTTPLLTNTVTSEGGTTTRTRLA